MRKPNNANKFKTRLAVRADKVEALYAEGTPDARRQHKRMSTPFERGRKPDARGQYGNFRPCRIRINGKNRPCLSAMKGIMSRH